MKTPMQELIEKVNQWMLDDMEVINNPLDYEEYMVMHANQMVKVKLEFIDMCKSLLEKEEDYHKRMREIVAQELHNLGMPTDRAIDQAAFESSYGYSDTNYNSFKEGVKWVIEQLKTFNTKEND